jgi:hypothetical protein
MTMIARFMLLTALLVGGASASAATDSPEAWPPIGPLPPELDKSKEPLHYGRKVEFFPAKLREILWNGRVRKDHPRLYVNKDTLPQLQERMKTHPAWPHIMRHAKGGDVLACAFVFLVTGDKAFARTALAVFDDERWLKTKLTGQGAPTYRNALIFDWCFYAIPEEKIEDIVTKLAKVGLDESSVDPGARESASFKTGRWAIFNDYTPAGGIDLGWSHIYPALAHHWPGTEVDYMNMWHPDGSSLSDQLAKEVRSIDGSSWWWPHQGKCWNGHEKWTKARFSFASATGIDIQDELEWGPNFNNRLYWILYCSSLDKKLYLNHYQTQHNAPLNEGPLFLRGGPGASTVESAILHTQNAVARNPHYQWFINQLVYGAEGGDPVQVYSQNSMHLIELALWYHPEVKELPPVGHGGKLTEGLPFARFLAPGEMQTAAFRSGFKGKGDTIALYNFSDGNNGDYGDQESLAHNSGNLVLYKDEYLITHTPFGPFTGNPWNYTGLSYFDTSTRAETGWDATVRPPWVSFHFQRDFIKKFPRLVTSKVRAFESRPDYDYLAAEGTPNYWSPKVSKEWTQQIVFLRPGVIVTFNRAEATEARYQPRWIMHMKGEWPEINSKKVRVIIPDHVEDYDGDELSYNGVMRQSRLHLKTLLPKDRHIRIVHGHLGDTPSTALVATTHTRAVERIDNLHNVPRDGQFTLMMKYKTPSGEEMVLPAIKTTAAVQRKRGNFILKVKSDRLQITQTEAQKDETFLFAHYPTIEELALALMDSGFRTEMCARFETWMEGVGPARDSALHEKLNVGPGFCPGSVRTPYDSRGRLSTAKEKVMMRHPSFANASAEAGRGTNRIGQTGHIEIRLPDVNAPTRNYFLNVLTATDIDGKSPAIPPSTLEENEGTATAFIQLQDQLVRVTFRKTGELGGHIKIEKDGKIVVNADFTPEIDLSNQAYGTDFLTGRQKLP